MPGKATTTGQPTTTFTIRSQGFLIGGEEATEVGYTINEPH